MVLGNVSNLRVEESMKYHPSLGYYRISSSLNLDTLKSNICSYFEFMSLSVILSKISGRLHCRNHLISLKHSKSERSLNFPLKKQRHTILPMLVGCAFATPTRGFQVASYWNSRSNHGVYWDDYSFWYYSSYKSWGNEEFLISSNEPTSGE